MRRPRVPLGLPIAIVVLLVLGFIAMAVIPSLAGPEQMATNVLLSAIPFILIFVAIILGYITVIVLVASMLNNVIAPRPHGIIMRIAIGGILLGIVGMFQPWALSLYTLGFIVLFISTLFYILWSHIVPRGEARMEELGPLSVSKLERRKA